MSPAALSPDARAVVRAADALTTQVRRIADALTTPVVDTRRPAVVAALTAEHYRRAEARIVASPEEHCEAMADAVMRVLTTADDAPTTPTDDGRRKARPLTLSTPCATCTHPYNWHPGGVCQATDCGCIAFAIEQRTEPMDPVRILGIDGCPTPETHNWGCGCPTDRYGAAACGHRGPHPGFTCAEVDQTRPYWDRRWDSEQQAPAADEERCITHFHGACDGTTPDCAFPTPGTGRRRRLRVLLNRLNNGIPLTADEAQALTQHVATEITEANAARRKAELADSVTAETKRLLERRTKTLRQRAKIAEAELRTLRAGLRANGADPTQIQNLWAQIRLRNRQWREAKREAAVTRSMLEAEGGDVALVDEMLATVAKAEGEAREAQAAIERVRALADQWDNALAPARSQYSGPVRAALDGTEQPTTEEN